MKTKKEQRDEAWERFVAIVAPARKELDAIVNPARRVYQARIREIDAQDKPLQVEKEL